MARPKPQPPQKPKPAPAPAPVNHGPAKRVVIERFGNNQYRVLELTYSDPPSSVKVLQKDVARVPAEDEVRLWLENFIGVDRFADSGL